MAYKSNQYGFKTIFFHAQFDNIKANEIYISATM